MRVMTMVQQGFLVTLLGLAGPALGQSPAGTLMTDPREIATCLCLNQSVQKREGELGAVRATYEALRQSIADQTTALNTKRPTVNVNDPTSVDAFRAQMEKRDDDEARLEQEVLPGLQTQTANYNARVADYSQRCGGRFMDEPVLKAVQKTLVCTIEP
ncbi:hypothetical protein VZ95_12220 [Elstera litoralis]|uniref:Lysozyme inhibitor LprI N-terminal domain-containing protein n=1 Tax=Elstera litoralis TaxID=552518 RepID=A0A0F3IRD8_9PROT|nr:hypothetical protein [Elstera litoralis]KJV09320.1 hypothetical protein VZ95_12220 [Elstera litoralis]